MRQKLPIFPSVRPTPFLNCQVLSKMHDLQSSVAATIIHLTAGDSISIESSLPTTEHGRTAVADAKVTCLRFDCYAAREPSMQKCTAAARSLIRFFICSSFRST